mmetsp:Transcript_18485/g.29999  ORF Transcript_18485/g.29999 Transcript_18485/m.29999 type:complete len:467 (-) Transcript_18485:103-1503(-)
MTMTAMKVLLLALCMQCALGARINRKASSLNKKSGAKAKKADADAQYKAETSTISDNTADDVEVSKQRAGDALSATLRDDEEDGVVTAKVDAQKVETSIESDSVEQVELEEMASFTFSYKDRSEAEAVDDCQESSLWSLCKAVVSNKTPKAKANKNCNECSKVLSWVLKGARLTDMAQCNNMVQKFKTKNCEDAEKAMLKQQQTEVVEEGLAKDVNCREKVSLYTANRQKRDSKLNILTQRVDCSKNNNDLYVWDEPVNGTNEVGIMGLSTSGNIGKIDIIRKTACSASGGSLMQFAISKFQEMRCRQVALEDDSGVSCSETESGPLRVVYGLKSNEKKSWYEKFGFRSTQPGYEEAKIVLDMAVKDFYDLLACKASHAERCADALRELEADKNAEMTVWDWMRATYIGKGKCVAGMRIARVFNGVFDDSWNSCPGGAGEVWSRYGHHLKVYGASWGKQKFVKDLQ